MQSPVPHNRIIYIYQDNLILEKVSCYVAKAGTELTAILLSQLSELWNYMCAPLCLKHVLNILTKMQYIFIVVN